MLWLLAIIWLICGIIAGTIHGQRGRSEGTGFLAGLILGPIGVLLAMAAQPDQRGRDQRALASGDFKKCPHCAELVRAEATTCRFCANPLVVA